MSPWKFILILLIIAMIVTFGAKNMAPVELKYYFGLNTQGIPLFFLLIAATAFGAFIVWLYFAVYQIRIKGVVKKQTKRIKELERELAERSILQGSGDAEAPGRQDYDPDHPTGRGQT